MNVLAKDYNMKEILKYVLPTVLMMVFMSTYTIIDGLFVANLVGEDALSAVNIAWPAMNVLFAIGLMLATGGTAIMGKLMGEGEGDKARNFLTQLYIIGTLLGIILGAYYQFGANDLATRLGASPRLFDYAVDYLKALSIFSIPLFLQIFTQTFFVVAGKPELGFGTCFLGGVTNIVLDYIFISPSMMGLGITGAGLATGIGASVPAIFGVLYFSFCRKGSLYFSRPSFTPQLLFQSMFNGMSELVSQSSAAITTLIFNFILLDLAGEAGIASISVILYVQMFQTSLYFGYALGVAPIISYKFGAKDNAGLRQVLYNSFKIISVMSLLVIFVSYYFGIQLVSIFISPDSDTFEMALNGFKLFSIGYLFMGLNIFISSMFTALSDGKTSAILSLARSLLFLIPTLIVLPKVMGINGVWLAVPLAELLAILVGFIFYKNKKIILGY